MKYCVNCHKQIKNDTKFCPFCGAKQPSTNAKSNVNAGVTGSTVNQGQGFQQDSYGYTQRPSGAQAPYQPQMQMVQPIVNKPITPPQCSFADSCKLFWENYANFNGYSSRSEFWWWFLIEEIINFIYLVVAISSFVDIITDGSLFMDPTGAITSFIGSFGIFNLWYLIVLIPNLSIRTRRFRDAGVPTGWTIALLIIDYASWLLPFIGLLAYLVARIATLVIECMPSVRKVVVNNQPSQQPRQ